MKLILFLLLISTLLFSLKTEAKELSSEYFSVYLDVGTHDHIAPDDYFSDTFTIENQTPYPIEVRVSDVSNVENSTLYTILQGSWSSKDVTDAYVSFDKLTTDWYVIDPGKTEKMILNIHFPHNLGNDYQASMLKAKFTFQCRIPKNKTIPLSTSTPIEHHTIVSVPNTGDNLGKQIFHILGNCVTALLAVTAIYCFCGMIHQKYTGNLFFPFGYRPVVILSGSMEEELKTGSTVLVKKTKNVEENDIIFFVAKDGTPVIHRCIDTDENGQLITKGDANPKEDLESVSLEQVQGKVVHIFKK